MRLIDHLFAIGVLLISIAFAFMVYVNSGQNTASIFWSIYAFGTFFLPGIITAYPGYRKHMDSSGFEVRSPRGRNLSKLQAIIIFSWLAGFGLVLVYVIQIKQLL